MSEEKQTSKYQIYKPEALNSSNYISEQFKSKLMVEDTDFLKSSFKEKLGEPHPFDYEIIEGVAKKFGLITAIIDKICDYTLGPGIFIESKNDKIKTILEKWISKTHYKSFLRQWFIEALMKGTGYQEIAGLSESQVDNTVKVINSNTMYIQRDAFENVTKYNQFIGETLQKINDNDIINLNSTEIIQLDINKIGSGAYGMGIIFSALGIINDFLNAQRSMHKLMERKANSPIHAKLGNVEKDDYPEQEDINNFGKKLQYMNNMTEWVTGPNVEMNVLDFGNISDKFKGIVENDLKLLSYAFQVPEAILGADKGFVGSTEIQEGGFERNIKAYQEQIAFVVKTKVLNIVLLNNGIINDDYEVIWGQPSEAEKRELRLSLKDLLAANIDLTPGMKLAYEKKLALLDDIDYDDVEAENKRVERKEKREQKRTFGQQKELQGMKQNPEHSQEENMMHRILEEYLTGKAPQEIELNIVKEFEMDSKIVEEKVNEEIEDLEKDVELENWVGEYIHIKSSILDVIKTDAFKSLIAKTPTDLKMGLLNKSQIEKVRRVFGEAFEKKLSLHKIAAKLEKIKFKDRFVKRDGKKVLSISKEKRAWMLARTETVRLRAEGSLEAFKNKGIEQVEFVNTSARPCAECESLSGAVFIREDAKGIIPVHSMCRCQWGEI